MIHRSHIIACTLFLAAFIAVPLRAAEIVFLNGNKVEGKVLSRDEKLVRIEIMKDGKTLTVNYALNLIHKITINDKTYIINDPSGGKSTRTKAEIDALIDKVGREPPEWFASAVVDYPKTLDLSWPEGPPEGGWNNQKNVGQFIWDILNPNPNRWHGGIKLMHELLQRHKDDPEKRRRIMLTIAGMYHNLLQDYGRAAFWIRQCDKEEEVGYRPRVQLADCYFRLGNKQMAIETLNKARVSTLSIKLWCDMGELPKAMTLAKNYDAKDADSGADVAFLHIGDGFRQAGKPKEAMDWYQKVLDIPQKQPPHGGLQRSQQRAQASLAAIKLYEQADPARVADGTYEAESLGYEANVRVAVTVKDKKIEQVKITQHREKQFYSSLTDTPTKIIAKQGVKGVDATAAATITSEAIINATAKALASGAK